MRDMQLRPLAIDDGIVFTPIELECLAWSERQRHKYAATRRLLLTLPVSPPITREGGNTTIGAGKAKNYQIGMKLLRFKPNRIEAGQGVGLQDPEPNTEARSVK